MQPTDGKTRTQTLAWFQMQPFHPVRATPPPGGLSCAVCLSYPCPVKSEATSAVLP